MRVARVQQPLQVHVRPALDHLADELDSEPAAAVLGQHVDVREVDEGKAFKTQSGNTRFVLRADDGSEYTTFKEAIARQAVAAEGRRARIAFHEQQRNGFTNVYLDKVEPLEEDEPEGEPRGDETDEVAWKTAMEAAPWLLGEAPAGGVAAEEAFEKLQPFKELVADDIRDEDGNEDDTPAG